MGGIPALAGRMTQGCMAAACVLACMGQGVASIWLGAREALLSGQISAKGTAPCRHPWRPARSGF
ncbi:hypothetical protein [Acetobacter tropicalis]|uniref:hypothetical protein n=1 Tax=Acetobacter tropicalis TaxID=104102 RepID=UPI00140BE906|nr:hypothetical protein [Acetobacter tropicalis]MBC9008825.1 hypothetical protein [Acetobacter tropicalis]MDO8171999.1 hypothetical protein [Acetobacter tropicalis]